MLFWRIYGIIVFMKKGQRDPKISELPISEGEFMKSYNANIPAAFPRTSIALLHRFREVHPSLFTKHDGMWSLDLHRKKLMDWLPRNGGS